MRWIRATLLARSVITMEFVPGMGCSSPYCGCSCRSTVASWLALMFFTSMTVVTISSLPPPSEEAKAKAFAQAVSTSAISARREGVLARGRSQSEAPGND